MSIQHWLMNKFLFTWKDPKLKQMVSRSVIEEQGMAHVTVSNETDWYRNTQGIITITQIKLTSRVYPRKDGSQMFNAEPAYRCHIERAQSRRSFVALQRMGNIVLNSSSVKWLENQVESSAWDYLTIRKHGFWKSQWFELYLARRIVNSSSNEYWTPQWYQIGWTTPFPQIEITQHILYRNCVEKIYMTQNVRLHEKGWNWYT